MLPHWAWCCVVGWLRVELRGSEFRNYLVFRQINGFSTVKILDFTIKSRIDGLPTVYFNHITRFEQKWQNYLHVFHLKRVFEEIHR